MQHMQLELQFQSPVVSISFTSIRRGLHYASSGVESGKKINVLLSSKFVGFREILPALRRFWACGLCKEP